MIFVVLLQTFFVLASSLAIAHFQNALAAWMYLTGGTLGLFSLLSFWFALRPAKIKKRMDLSIGVIVMKYAILGLIVYLVAGSDWDRQFWFGLGLITIVVTAFFASTILSYQTDESNQASGVSQ